MARGRSKQKAEAKHTAVHEDTTDAAGAVARPRSSKFKEGTMNSTMSIHPPPDEFWHGLDIENMIKGFNEENSAPVSATGVVLHAHARTKSTSHTKDLAPGSAVPATPTVGLASEGTFGRMWRPISTFFNGAGASITSLGKRKAGSESAEARAGDKSAATEKVVQRPSYDSKEDVEAAYHRAREQGLMPTPKVFIRPASRARRIGTSHLTCMSLHLHAVPPCEGSQADEYIIAPTSTPETPTASTSSLAPPKTPTLYKSPSKKDLHKQQKLIKRVSELELKLASARKELGLVLASPGAPPVPPIPANLPSPPTSTHFFSENETSPRGHARTPSSNLNPSSKIIKKRKATIGNDEEFKSIATDSEMSHDSERETKRSKQTPPKKLKKSPSSRVLKKKSTVTTTKEEVVTMVPDGVNVPPIPSMPKGVEGKKAAVRNDDGYGGFGDEMF